jgi:hypothetical protein
MSEMVPCRLCGKCMTLRAMQKHMGHHHEQLALFALPPNLDGTEEDHEEDELNSLSNNDDAGSDKEWLENEESDMSDASDPDEIADERQRFVEAVESLEGPISPDTFRKIFTGLGSTEDEADDITYGVGDSEPQIELEAKAGHLSDSLHNDTDSELGITDLAAQRNYRKKLRERLEELVSCDSHCTLWRLERHTDLYLGASSCFQLSVATGRGISKG